MQRPIRQFKGRLRVGQSAGAPAPKGRYAAHSGGHSSKMHRATWSPAPRTQSGHEPTSADDWFQVGDQAGHIDGITRMRPFEKVAVDFAAALVAGEFEKARVFLSRECQAEFPAGELRRRLFGMFESYAEGDQPTSIQFDDEFSLVRWPAQQPGDVGWAYVGILGEEFVEAVSVVVSDKDGALLIRAVEWGRP